MLIGLIADTHGQLRTEALAALHGVDVILHAGDVGALSILRELEALAPVHAVAGNVDDPAFGLPASIDLALGGVRVHLSHGHELGSPTPDRLVRAYGADIIVYGHTHKPLIETRDRTLIVNPGSAGPRRFNLTPSVARLTLTKGASKAEILPLGIP